MKKRPFPPESSSSSSDEIDAYVDVSGISDEYEEFKGQSGRLVLFKGDGNCLFRALSYGQYGDEFEYV